MWYQTIVDWSKRKVAWWYEKRSWRRCATASWWNRTKSACGKENGGGKNSGGPWAFVGWNAPLGMEKEESVNVMEAMQKRRTIVVLLLEKIGSCGYINDSYYCVSWGLIAYGCGGDDVVIDSVHVGGDEALQEEKVGTWISLHQF